MSSEEAASSEIICYGFNQVNHDCFARENPCLILEAMLVRTSKTDLNRVGSPPGARAEIRRKCLCPPLTAARLPRVDCSGSWLPHCLFFARRDQKWPSLTLNQVLEPCF